MSGALGFGLLKLSLDGLALAGIPAVFLGGYLLLGLALTEGEIVSEPDVQQQLVYYGLPAAVLASASIIVAACGLTARRRILRRAGIPGRAAIGWSAFGVLIIPWLLSFAALAFATLGIASTQNYSPNDLYWAMWPIFVVAVTVDTAFGAVTGAFATLWMTHLRARRAGRATAAWSGAAG
ncbi:hypothetical protein B7R25_05490 [Subtercola boreus]|uniref:Uncharacterized protein n=1 Tax=Subtercola boreus TaxID=120213 RepID=A0A3E0WE45_9MICO|nr:hypothetical protein [Subtercola boreus]RFA22118.1 hypothetical protein B7R24_05420 [Subtercola boreus]RFA22298.1 hypothetical protein B7R23_05365 [Subtercola boreus]RFA28162.1 hypothetical protein B7R25_05490 [Subtercola boreus]